MTVVTANSIINLISDTVDVAVAETCIDHAVNILNMYGEPYGIMLPNLSGTSGSMTLSVRPSEAAAIVQVAIEVFHQDYTHSGSSSGSDNTSVGALNSSKSTSDNTGNSILNAVAQDAIRQLQKLNFAVSIG
jgi:hypothetical protein